MFQDTSRGVNGISRFEEAYLWGNEDGNEREFDHFSSAGQAQMKSPKHLPSSAFKVYDRVLERHRYIPRKWTQEEFEAALPQRFKGKTYHDSEAGFEKETNVDGFHLSENETLTANEKINQLSDFSNPQKKRELKEKIKNLKAIFEKAGKSNGEFETSSINMEIDSSEKVEMDKTQVEELERCKDSEAKVKLIEEADSAGNCDENSERVNTESSNNTFSSFLNAFLRCLLKIESFIGLLSNTSENNPIMVKLKFLTQSIENPQQFELEDVFLKFLEKFSECQNCDEVLAIFLEMLIEETSLEDASNLRSLFQGEFCHITTCDSCGSIAKDFEKFLFLNPTTPAVHSPDRVFDINFLSCSYEGIWSIATQQFVIKPGMLVNDLVEELLSCPEFNGCDSIHIGEVSGGRLIRTFNKNDELSTIGPNSDIFAFNVLNFSNAFTESSRTSRNTAMPYHLYFNCGLCLGDGKEVGLFTHKKCGGMICRDCLDVITQSYHEWEHCPCPICEQAIDLDKDLCGARMSGIREGLTPGSNLLCEVMFRADRNIDGGAELFGCPLMVSIPQRVTGYHLYRCIGYLLPNTLPMKDRTSFTLHTVDKSGHGCSACSLNSCNGCLVRIDDNVRITRDTNVVVHFDDLAEESKKNFGMCLGNPVSDSRGVFDGILQSCVRASTSERMVCSKCSSVCKVSSSVSEFPHLLIIYLNHLYADQGLPPNTTVADISRFLVLQHGDHTTHSSTEDLIYQITAVALADESSTVPSYKTFVQKTTNDVWLLHDECFVREINPNELQITKNSVLFYQPVKNQDPSHTGHVLRMPFPAQIADMSKEVTEPDRACNSYTKLATISEVGTGMEFKRAKQGVHPKTYDRQLEPGEYLVGRGAMNLDIYSSQLSLGEIAHDVGFSSHLSADFDGISPIPTQEACGKTDSKLLRETKKLIRAVKQEDAYGIVCALKRGGNPCLVINDVSALHIAAGIKSDQRRSMVSYLIKFANDVNVGTADGTTPLHVAAAWGHQDALELLLTHGGDAFDLTDQDGNTAFDLASKDCSSFLQLLHQSDGNSPGSFEPATSSRASLAHQKAQRLEDIVRSNVTLPSFVHEEDTNRSRLRRRWLKRFRSFRDKSSGVFRSLKRMSSIRRRSRIGVMVQENGQDENISEKL